MQRDMEIDGHQWTIGMSGMCLFFSKRETIALSIESGAGDGRYFKGVHSIKSKWITPMDISNVMPKTVLSVDEHGGPRRFELAISVTVCPDVFARTKLITILPSKFYKDRCSLCWLLPRFLTFLVHDRIPSGQPSAP